MRFFILTKHMCKHYVPGSFPLPIEKSLGTRLISCYFATDLYTYVVWVCISLKSRLCHVGVTCRGGAMCAGEAAQYTLFWKYLIIWVLVTLVNYYIKHSVNDYVIINCVFSSLSKMAGCVTSNFRCNPVVHSVFCKTTCRRSREKQPILLEVLSSCRKMSTAPCSLDLRPSNLDSTASACWKQRWQMKSRRSSCLLASAS